ncbi:MAG: hypothetical protein ACRYF6_07010 [Janthinobacterium lividum]
MTDTINLVVLRYYGNAEMAQAAELPLACKKTSRRNMPDLPDND